MAISKVVILSLLISLLVLNLVEADETVNGNVAKGSPNGKIGGHALPGVGYPRGLASAIGLVAPAASGVIVFHRGQPVTKRSALAMPT
ncbi:hypothetical protein L484_016051 [Morus notabilis]|uniref:Uncharacterized protein n=1 Tax=Morus notabilis TaxID=981085 RepID=W9RWP9_9ROSA|nr:hypothetical protein L484_016051 [Morus notabilis]